MPYTPRGQTSLTAEAQRYQNSIHSSLLFGFQYLCRKYQVTLKDSSIASINCNGTYLILGVLDATLSRES